MVTAASYSVCVWGGEEGSGSLGKGTIVLLPRDRPLWRECVSLHLQHLFCWHRYVLICFAGSGTGKDVGGTGTTDPAPSRPAHPPSSLPSCTPSQPLPASIPFPSASPIILSAPVSKETSEGGSRKAQAKVCTLRACRPPTTTTRLGHTLCSSFTPALRLSILSQGRRQRWLVPCDNCKIGLLILYCHTT